MGELPTLRIVQAKMNGRMGNQLFQYACVRKYCQLYDAKLEVNDWIGIRAFGLNDPLWSCTLPEKNDQMDNNAYMVNLGEVNIRLGGYFQQQCWINTLSRKEVKLWFQPQEKWLNKLPAKTIPYTAVHLRRGDYVNHPQYCTVSKESYRIAIEKFGHIGEIKWVSEETALNIEQFNWQGLYALPDFIKIMQADAIYRANSTFSWWAATLSDAKIYSPVVEDKVLENTVDFVDGNHPKCAHTDRVGVPITDLYLPE